MRLIGTLLSENVLYICSVNTVAFPLQEGQPDTAREDRRPLQGRTTPCRVAEDRAGQAAQCQTPALSEEDSDLSVLAA